MPPLKSFGPQFAPQWGKKPYLSPHCVAPTGCPGDCGKQHPPPPLEEGKLKALSSLNKLRKLLCPPPTV